MASEQVMCWAITRSQLDNADPGKKFLTMMRYLVGGKGAMVEGECQDEVIWFLDNLLRKIIIY